MNRRTFAGLSLAALGGIFVPQYGRWHRQGSGLLVREEPVLVVEDIYGNVLFRVPMALTWQDGWNGWVG